MTARNLLSELRQKGVEIKASGDDRLVIDAPKGAITPELRSALAAHKVELLQILKSEQQPPAPIAPPTELKTHAPEVVAAPVALTRPADEDDAPAGLATEEIRQLEGELIRLKAEEQTRRAEFEAIRLAAENALRAEHERRSQVEAESSRQRAEQEKQRIAAEAREHAEEENRRRIAERELLRAEEELKRMRAMEDARRADVDARLSAAEEAHRAELETRRQAEEEQARVYSEEQRRLLEAEARKRAQEDELRRHAEMRFQAVEVEIARVQAREAARRKSAEDARVLAEQAAQRRAEEEARRHAEESALRRAEDEARLRAQIEAQMRAEAEARRQVEDEARRQAEEEARRRAEEEANRMAAMEAQRRAEEAARQHAEAESRRQAEEAARRRAEEEALRQAETEAKLRAAEESRQKAADEVRQHAEMEARIRSEIAAKIRAEDEARHQAAADSHRPEPASNQTEQYPFEIERSEVGEPPAREGKANEIVEWFDVGIESQGAVSADQHPAHENFAGLMQDDSGGEFHAVSVPETERAPSAVSAATLSQLTSDKAPERAAAVMELARSGGEDAFRHINAAFDDQSVDVRNTAARALFNSQDDRAAAFTRALREATPARRRKIGAAIASSGLAQEAIRNLTGESRDKTYDAFSLLFLMSKAGEVQPLMRAIEDHSNIEVRLAVVKLLALSGQPDILPAFRRMAVRGSLPPEVRSAVMEAIYQITSQSPADAPSMV
jgi:tubulysin polyketide synthase-like protein/HEAT repeat protein